MAVYKEDIVSIDLERAGIHRSFLNHSIGMTDNNADRFGVRVYRNGEPVSLAGVTVQGYFRDPMGNNIAITSGNTVDGNKAVVVLPQACYNYEGQFTLAIKLVGGGVTGTIRIVDGVVDNTNTGGAVAPTEAVPSYQEVLAVYNEAIAAVEDVEAMADGMNAKVYTNKLFNNSFQIKDMEGFSETEKYNYLEITFDKNSDLIIEISGFNYKSTGTNTYDRAGFFFFDDGGDLVRKLICSDGGFHTIVKTPKNATKLIVNGTIDENGNDDKPMITVYRRPFVSVVHDLELYRTNGTIYNAKSHVSAGEYYSYIETCFIPGDDNYIRIRGNNRQTGTIQYAGYTFFDEDDEIVEVQDASELGVFDKIVHAPGTACRVIVNGNVTPEAGLYFGPVAQPASQFEKQDESDSSTLKGKKIVWFGTSIPEGRVNGKSYPTIIGSILKATVYNESLGSSPMSDNVPINACRMKALALTAAEKQAKSWYGELTEEQKTTAINSSFDHKFTKYLTGGSVGPVDLYVFDHGYNDYYYLDDSDYMTEPDNPNDKYYPLGAANFLINAILQDNPRAKIVWIGHYENALDDPTDHQSWGKPVAEFQEYISEKYGIPLCKTWEKTGWSNPHKVTTTGYWQNGYWINSGGQSRQDYVKNCAFSDGIHPHTDLSGESTEKLATIIADWLITVF